MEPPQNRKELQWFLGLCGYYRRFIPKYAGLVFPLLKLLKSAAGWCWNEARTIAFDRARKLLQHSPVLRLPQFDKPFFVTTDASDTAVGGVFSQFHDGVKHPVALSSRKLSITEKRWPAYEKDLFAFKFCFEKWRTYLLGQVFTLYADNSACKWFFRKPTPSPKLLRRLDFFGQFTFKVFRRPGTTNVVVNTLLRSIVVQTLALFEPDPAFCERVKALYMLDPLRVDLIRRLSMNDPIAICKYRLEDNLICIKEGDRVVFPRDDRLLLHLLVHYHEDAIMAHPGVVRTYLALRQNFAWKKMRSSIEDYVRTCETSPGTNQVIDVVDYFSRCQFRQLPGRIPRWIS